MSTPPEPSEPAAASAPPQPAAPGRTLQHTLHVAPTPFFSDRGCHIRIRGLVTALARRGVSATVCTYHHGREVPGVRTSRIVRVPGYQRIAAGPSPFKYLADVLLGVLVLVRTLRERPALLHGHLHEGALLAWAVSRLLFWRRIPVVFDMQGSLSGELAAHGYFRRGRALQRLFGAIERFIDHRPDAIACSSEQSLQITASRFQVAPERLFLVPDGVDTQQMHADGEVGGTESPEQKDTDPTSVLDRLQLPSGRPVVVYSGALLPVKGLDILHGVLVQAQKLGLDAHFLLVGYPTGPTRRLIQAHALQERCTLTGRVPFEQLGPLLARADLAIEPKAGGSGEASGKLLNYMAAGLPVVAFDTPNNRAILGDCGCYASRGSVDEMVEAIRQLCRAPDRRRALGAAARARARDRFSWDRSAERLIRIYNRVLAARQRHDRLGES